MDSSFWFDTYDLRWSIVYLEESHDSFPDNQLFFVLFMANGVYPDEMRRYVAFYLGLHCLQNNSFRSHQYTKGKLEQVIPDRWNIWASTRENLT